MVVTEWNEAGLMMLSGAGRAYEVTVERKKVEKSGLWRVHFNGVG